MSGDGGSFQFNQGVDEVLGREAKEIPAHIQGMDVLKGKTKGQLADLEAAMRRLGATAEKDEDMTTVTTPPPPDLTAELTPVPDEVAEETRRDMGADEGGGYLDFVEDDQDILNNDDLREAVERRCDPLSLTGLITTGRARQRVPIVPNQFEVVFQTTNGEEDLYIKDRLMGVVGSPLSVQQRYADMNLSLGVVSINGESGPPAYKDDQLDGDGFDARVAWLRRMPVPLLVSLHTNYAWFERRTRKLFAFRGDHQVAADPAGVEQG